MPRCAMAERCIERPVAPFQAPGAAAEKSRLLLTPITNTSSSLSHPNTASPTQKAKHIRAPATDGSLLTNTN